MQYAEPRNIREALNQIGDGLTAFFRHNKEDETSKITLFFFKLGSIIAWFFGFGIAIFKYDRDFKDAVLFGTHCFLYFPSMVAGLVLLVATFLVFTTIKQGVYNYLADRWEANFRSKNPDVLSWEYPHYRFMIPSALIAAILSLIPIAMLAFLGAVVSAFSPYGMPNLFGSD